MRRRIPVLVEAAACVLALLGASLLYRQFFATPDYLPPLAAAASGGVLVAAVRRTGPLLITGFAGFLLVATYGVFTDSLRYGLPTLDTGKDLLWGVLGGWARMLTIGLPADVRGDLLITPVLVTWVAAILAGRLTRTKSVLAPIAPPLAAFVIALLLVGNRPGVQVLPTALLLGGILVLIMARAGRIDGSDRTTASGLAFGLPVIAVIAALGVAGGLFLPLASGQDRFDPRDLHPPPVAIADTLTPLAQVKNQLKEQPARRLFTVQPDHQIDRIRTAALDDYNGTLWTSADKFVVAGRKLAADQPLPHTVPVSAAIEIDDLGGPFLPALGRPTRFDSAEAGSGRIGFSATAGVLATTDNDPRGLRYTVAGDISVRDDSLTLALPSASARFVPYTRLPPGLPAQIQLMAQELTSSQTAPYGQLVAIEQYLRSLPYSLDADPGHSYGALTRLLTGTQPGDDLGYAEQHAAAFAVLARAIGFPARVAVGYRVPANGIVTTAEAHAWAEVAFDDYGWVPFEPTDPTRNVSDRRTQSDSPVIGPPQDNPPLAAPPVLGPQPDTSGEGGNGWGAALRTTAFAAIGVAGLGIVGAICTAAAKARRRRRRRKALGADRVLGAWREVTDRLSERGIRFPISATADEIAVLLGNTGAVRSLATLATKAVFAPDQVTDEDGERAWELEPEIRRSLAPGRFSPRRLWTRFDPRPLLATRRDTRQSRRNLERLGVG
ncbi:transglutaminaseTgpA domain-containing protein [Actinocrispum sp. NPDC049592]|uniref:DUF3488 and transglutaminase-like domain-containing protein n=1 Tax=Actinocrispum sp. NPDC049592 TaxID=3154835 RepID=UPI0034312965